MAKAKTKAGQFPCKYGKKLNQLMRKARHDKGNIMVMRIARGADGKAVIIDGSGYDKINQARKLQGENKPISKEDCNVVCGNMQTQDAIDFIGNNCSEGELHCLCKQQICDDVYETHGHGRPNEESIAALKHSFAHDVIL